MFPNISTNKSAKLTQNTCIKFEKDIILANLEDEFLWEEYKNKTIPCFVHCAGSLKGNLARVTKFHKETKYCILCFIYVNLCNTNQTLQLLRYISWTIITSFGLPDMSLMITSFWVIMFNNDNKSTFQR